MQRMVSTQSHRYRQVELSKFETFDCDDKDVEWLIKLRRAELEDDSEQDNVIIEPVVMAQPVVVAQPVLMAQPVLVPAPVLKVKRKRGRPRKVA